MYGSLVSGSITTISGTIVYPEPPLLTLISSIEFLSTIVIFGEIKTYGLNVLSAE